MSGPHQCGGRPYRRPQANSRRCAARRIPAQDAPPNWGLNAGSLELGSGRSWPAAKSAPAASPQRGTPPAPSRAAATVPPRRNQAAENSALLLRPPASHPTPPDRRHHLKLFINLFRLSFAAYRALSRSVAAVHYAIFRVVLTVLRHGPWALAG